MSDDRVRTNSGAGRPREHDEGTRTTTGVRLDKDLYKRAKHAAIDRDTSVNHLINKALAYYLDRLPPLEPTDD